MHDPHSESDSQPTEFEHFEEPISPQPPPAKKSLLRKLGPFGLLLFYLFGKLKYVGVILQIGKFKTFITMLISIWLMPYSGVGHLRLALLLCCLSTRWDMSWRCE